MGDNCRGIRLAHQTSNKDEVAWSPMCLWCQKTVFVGQLFVLQMIQYAFCSVMMMMMMMLIIL